LDTGAWRIVDVDTDGWTGRDTCLVLDGAGRPRISCYHPGNMDLRYAAYVY
jgi:hypothetical protein